MKNLNKPWIDKIGRALSDEILKEVSKNWDTDTWESYLKTLETGIEGVQIASLKEFNDRCEKMTASIFEFSSGESLPELQNSINNALKNLTEKQAIVIQKYYFEGKSEREIATELKKRQGTIQEIKKTALSRIKTQLEENPFVLTLIRGTNSFSKDPQGYNQWFLEELFPQEEHLPFRALANKEELINEGGSL